MYERPILSTLRARLTQPRRFIQALVGPRQVGKTTIARQLIQSLSYPTHFASADEPGLKGTGWIAQQWETARFLMKGGERSDPALLVLDELQKIPDWSETVKRLWDQDTAEQRPLHVMVLGSTPLLIRKGLAESLAGRFEVVHATHWSWSEMRDAFGWELDRYIYFGGYPGSAPLVDDEKRWRSYLLESLVETTISRDVLLMQRVDKPALLRRVFALACEYSGQVLAYQKMVGQLQDAGNTTTIAGYLDLLERAGMVAGLQKYAGEGVRRRASSPKLQVYNNGLGSVHQSSNFQIVRNHPEEWGRKVESAIGAHLLNIVRGTEAQLYYWRGRSQEVDYVLAAGRQILAIEVKSGKREAMPVGMNVFIQEFANTATIRSLLVGSGGIPVQAFLAFSLEELLA